MYYSHVAFIEAVFRQQQVVWPFPFLPPGGRVLVADMYQAKHLVWNHNVHCYHLTAQQL